MRYIVLFAFFFSGFASLVLENIWVRMMTLVFGGTTLAVVTVLSAFMGGIALGSYLAGRWLSRAARPIALYGLLECIVAAYSLLLPFVIDQLPRLYRVFPFDESQWGIALLRFGICTLLLLLPTTMMGATLPVLSHFFVRSKENIGVETGVLYGMNTLGAVAGALVGGFVVLPLFGHQRGLWVTAGLLGCLGITMLLLGRSDALAMPKQAEEEKPSTTRQPLPPESQLAMWLLGLTGALAMVCQVIWSRTMAMIIGSSTYAFSLLLGLFLIGLALGSLWGAKRLKQGRTPRKEWFLMLLATALTVSIGIWVMDMLPLWFAQLVIHLKGYNNALLLFAIKALIAALPVLLPTFFMGTFFPYALALYAAGHDTEETDDSQDTSGVGHDVGNVYAANTLGAIIGSAAAGFVVIPLLGLQFGLAMCVGLYLVSAWALFAIQSVKKAVPFGVTTLVCCAAVFTFPSWNPGWLSLGMFRVSAHQFDQGLGIPSPGNLLFYKEGMSATVSVHGNDKQRSLRVNGKTDASTHGDWKTQVGIAAMPLLAHPNPQDVALVGWGSGITAGAALHFPLKHLTAIELEPAVIEGSRYFKKWNYAPWNDKRLKLLANDGRNFLAATSRSFDVIISEPSNPWISGQANLFTREYFQLTKKRLKPDGIFCQWVQFYELSYKNIILILQTLHSVYPHVYMFEPEYADSDKIILASRKPLKLDPKRLAKLMKQRRLRRLLASIQMRAPRDIFARYLLGGPQLKAYLKKAPQRINTDGYNKLEFSAPFDLVRATTTSDASNLGATLRAKGLGTAAVLLGKDDGEFDLPTTGKGWLERAVSSLLFGYLGLANQELKIAQKLDPSLKSLSSRFHWLMALSKVRKVPPPPKVPQGQDATALPWKALLKARKLYLGGRYMACQRALAEIELTAAMKPRESDLEQVWLYRAYCAFEQKQYTNALREYARYRKMALKPSKKPRAKNAAAPTSRPVAPSSRPTAPAASQPASRAAAPTSRPTPAASKPTTRSPR